MGIIILFFVVAIISIVLSNNRFILKHDFEDLFGAIGWISIVSIVCGIISSLILFGQVMTRQSDYTSYYEKQQKCLSYKGAKAITAETQRMLLDDISEVNKHILNTKKYRKNKMIGMYYNPLVEDLSVLDYKFIVDIPLHQNFVVEK